MEIKVVELTLIFCILYRIIGKEAKCDQPSNAQQSLASSIIQWWDRVSVEKPISCQLRKNVTPNPMWNTPGRQKAILFSYLCPNDTTNFERFELRGNITADQGKLKGTGIVLLGPRVKNDYNSNRNANFVCLGSDALIYRVVKKDHMRKVIGTFVNGSLHGPVKIELLNDQVIIGHASNGEWSGLVRLWTSKNHLHKICTYHLGLEVGPCWTRFSDYLSFADYTPFNRTKYQNEVLLIDMKNVGDSYLGAGLAHSIFFVENATQALLINVSSLNDCILLPKYAPSGSEELMVIDASAGVKLTTSETFNVNACKSALNKDEGDLSDRLKKAILSADIIHNLMRHVPDYKNAPLEMDKALSFLSIVQLDNPAELTGKVRVWDGPEVPFKLDSYNLDNLNRCHGRCVLSFPNITLMAKDRLLKWRMDVLSGFFVHGRLQGMFMAALSDNRLLFARCQNGVIHGPVAIKGVTNIMPGRRLTYTSSLDIGFWGWFRNGFPSGPIWIRMHGNSSIHATMEEGNNGTLTGDNIAFIYQDMETALLGRFENGIMIKAKESAVQEIGCSQEGILQVTKFAKPSGPDFYFDPPTNDSFGAGPPGVIDPFERKQVMFSTSLIPNSGTGVFALKNMSVGDIACLYTGFIYDIEQHHIYKSQCSNNISLSDDHRRHCSKYSIGIASGELTIEFPPDYDQPDIFHPTFGQKINHHFLANNTAFTTVEHARWGLIIGVVVTKPIMKGDELYGYYGYGMNVFPYDKPWYFEAENLIKKELRLQSEKKKKE